jgi:hypothetical protein
MSPECTACSRRPLPAAPWLGFASGLATLAVPKCPLCVAAALSVLGIGFGTASALTSWLPGLGAMLCAASIVAFWRRRAASRRLASASES